jgi:O-antigen/teichoic acid export membrane protein
VGFNSSMIEIVRKYILQGNPRSILAKKNIIGSLFARFASISINLVMIPLTINYVNPSRFGIWLALSSVVGWVSFFDIGFTNGLRNKFAEAKAKGDDQLARNYLSTAYVFLSAIFGSLLVVLLAVNHFIDWGALLNIPNAVEEHVSTVAAIVITYFCFLFVLRIVTTVLTADQKPALSSLVDMLGQLISLGVIFVLTLTVRGSLMLLTLALCVPTIVILLLAHLFLYRSTYSAYSPSFRLARKEYAKDIMGLGVKFFIPQIACIIQFQTTAFLIAHYFDVTQVTTYYIAYKYFNVLLMAFTILITPLWSSVTDSYTRGDEAWIKHVVNRYLYALLAFVAAALLMLFFSNTIYDLWIGKNLVHVGFNISLLCCLFVITGMFASIFVSVINGIGALKIQFISSFFTPPLFILMSLLFIKSLGIGVEGILISSIIANVFGLVIAPIQYYQIFITKSTAKVWYA